MTVRSAWLERVRGWLPPGFWLAAPLFLVVAGTGIYVARSFIEISINTTPSLPGRVFLVQKWALPERGGYLAFHYPSNAFYTTQTTVCKRVGGVGGDVVAQHEGWYTVNGQRRGYAKFSFARSLQITLQPGPVGLIPEGMYFVYGDHEDSFDSRYREVGWIRPWQVVGRCVPVF